MVSAHAKGIQIALAGYQACKGVQAKGIPIPRRCAWTVVPLVCWLSSW